MGTTRYLESVNAECIDTDAHKYNGTRALMRTRHGTYLVCACPSTARVYHMEVPPGTKTCEKADEYLRGDVTGRMVGAS